MEEKNQYTTSDEVYEIVEDNDLQLNLIGMLRKIVKIRKRLYKTIIIAAVLALGFAFSIPKKYSVSITMAPEVGAVKSSSGLMGMAASFLGGGINTGGHDALNVLMSPEIISSTPFLMELLESRVGKDNEATLSSYLEKETVPWWSYVMGLPSMVIGSVKSLFVDESVIGSAGQNVGPLRVSKRDAKKLKKMRSVLGVDVDKKRSLVALSVVLQDPVVTAIVADSVVAKLQKYVTNYKISKAKEDCRYWEKLAQENKDKYYAAQQRYAQFVDENSNVIYQSTMVERERLQNDMSLAYQVYSQVEQQLQMAKAKVQEKKPVFTIIEPAVVPLQKANTSKLVILIGFIFIGLAGVISWELILKDFYERFRRDWFAPTKE